MPSPTSTHSSGTILRVIVVQDPWLGVQGVRSDRGLSSEKAIPHTSPKVAEVKLDITGEGTFDHDSSHHFTPGNRFGHRLRQTFFNLLANRCISRSAASSQRSPKNFISAIGFVVQMKEVAQDMSSRLAAAS